MTEVSPPAIAGTHEGRAYQAVARDEAELAARLRVAVVRMTRRTRQQRVQESLSLNQFSALSTLVRHGPMAPRELAEHERVRPPSVSQIIAALEGQGLATRTAHPTDGRQAVVAVTDAGEQLVRTENSAKEKWLAQQLGELHLEERELLARACDVMERIAGR